MTQLVDGKRYRLPTGQMVKARHTAEGFLLEFRTKSTSPIHVDPAGLLTVRGEAVRLTVDCLTEAPSGSDEASALEMHEIMNMVLDIQEQGGEVWKALKTTVQSLHARAMGFDTR